MSPLELPEIFLAYSLFYLLMAELQLFHLELFFRYFLIQTTFDHNLPLEVHIVQPDVAALFFFIKFPFVVNQVIDLTACPHTSYISPTVLL